MRSRKLASWLCRKLSIFAYSGRAAMRPAVTLTMVSADADGDGSKI